MRPVGHGEAPVLEAHDLLGRFVLPDRREQLPERSPLLLLRLAAQLCWWGWWWRCCWAVLVIVELVMVLLEGVCCGWRVVGDSDVGVGGDG